MIAFKNFQAMLFDRVRNGVFDLVGLVAPTDGTTGVNIGGLGSTYIDTVTGIRYTNVGSATAPVWIAETKSKTGTITSAQITDTGAGNLGHASGLEILPAQGAGTIVELVSVELFYDYLTAAYGGGGNVTVNYTGGSAITGLVSAANSMAAAADKPIIFYPLTAAALAALVNTGLSLVAASAFTQPGTAAGVIDYVVNYRVRNTGF